MEREVGIIPVLFAEIRKENPGIRAGEEGPKEYIQNIKEARIRGDYLFSFQFKILLHLKILHAIIAVQDWTKSD